MRRSYTNTYSRGPWLVNSRRHIRSDGPKIISGTASNVHTPAISHVRMHGHQTLARSTCVSILNNGELGGIYVHTQTHTAWSQATAQSISTRNGGPNSISRIGPSRTHPPAIVHTTIRVPTYVCMRLCYRLATTGMLEIDQIILTFHTDVMVTLKSGCTARTGCRWRRSYTSKRPIALAVDGEGSGFVLPYFGVFQHFSDTAA
jgi:hypothetical protein